MANYAWDDSAHGHPIREGGDALHHSNGEHRSTPPSTSGIALARHEAAIRSHLAAHEAHGK